MRLNGKTALVTGATSSIGQAVALALAKQGASIVVTGRNVDRLAAIAKTLKSGGNQVLSVPADVCQQRKP